MMRLTTGGGRRVEAPAGASRASGTTAATTSAIPRTRLTSPTFEQPGWIPPGLVLGRYQLATGYGSRLIPVAANQQGVTSRALTDASHFQCIPHRGDCRKPPVVSHNRRPSQNLRRGV